MVGMETRNVVKIMIGMLIVTIFFLRLIIYFSLKL
jgi:hypothetical protein